MNLKRQLLVTSLLMLLIPWAGIQFVLELDQALREQAREQLHIQAGRLASLSGDALIGQAPVTGDQPALYVSPVQRSLNPDGYADDWPGYEEGETDQPWQTTTDQTDPQAPGLRWQAAANGRDLYLIIGITNRQPRLFDPGNPNAPHDGLMLWVQEPTTTVDGDPSRRSWLIRISAPGKFSALTGRKYDQTDYFVAGSWQPVPAGWQLEIQMPKPDAGARMGFAVVDNQKTPVPGLSTSLDPLPVLVAPEQGLQRLLATQLNPGQRIRVLEPAGWVTASAQQATEQQPPEFDQLGPLQIVEQISLNALRALIRRFQPEPSPAADDSHRIPPESLPADGLTQTGDGQLWLQARAEVFGGRTLVLEQSLDQLLTLSGSALGSVLARSLLVISGLTLVLLGYASWLSWRISRLQKAVSACVDHDGRISGTLPSASATDELGQLQNHFAQMVERLQGYTGYLESFSRRLSHELKTPVAIVRTSVDNLEHTEPSEDQRAYLNRISQATGRLSHILQSMSEASRLEQSFDRAEHEPFDLAQVIAETARAYQAMDSAHQITYQGPPAGCDMQGSPELLVQMLDKLVDNARDFTPPQGQIEIRLNPDEGRKVFELSVYNEGSSLPEDLSGDIFSPFVSVRSDSQEGHLGQGLLIVQLIAEHHGGRVDAENVDGGVLFRVILPAHA
ncbi:ATP-binding protein [Marinobacter sp. F4216]|uniref:ATP-binding protein n=1 Tax=Marinobacter sp. F4216 TaxID=2874281 RepID=UPI001CBDD0AF|nr:ATP-binding protein [Marinobacter sp. F4216]MBZ2169327.1 histidine kinase [Marinobacter sp. F4216]